MHEKLQKPFRYLSRFCIVSLCLLLPSKCIFHAFLSRDEADILIETIMEDSSHVEKTNKENNENMDNK